MNLHLFVSFNVINIFCVDHLRVNIFCVDHLRVNVFCVDHLRVDVFCVDHWRVNVFCVDHLRVNIWCGGGCEDPRVSTLFSDLSFWHIWASDTSRRFGVKINPVSTFLDRMFLHALFLLTDIIILPVQCLFKLSLSPHWVLFDHFLGTTLCRTFTGPWFHASL